VEERLGGFIASEVLAIAQLQEDFAETGHGSWERCYSTTEAPAVAVVAKTVGWRSNFAV
jgi:hypothetical protein